MHHSDIQEILCSHLGECVILPGLVMGWAPKAISVYTGLPGQSHAETWQFSVLTIRIFRLGPLTTNPSPWSHLFFSLLAHLWTISSLSNNEEASLMAQSVKNLPAVQETQVWSLGGEDSLENLAIHSSIFAWEIPSTEESMGLQKSDMT